MTKKGRTLIIKYNEMKNCGDTNFKYDCMTNLEYCNELYVYENQDGEIEITTHGWDDDFETYRFIKETQRAIHLYKN